MSGRETILVVRWGRLGDVLLAAAATRELRRSFPEARIDFAVKRSFAEAAALLPGVDRILALDGSGLLDLLRFRSGSVAKRVDLFVDLHGNARSRLLAILVRPRRRVVYDRLALTRRALVRWKRGKGMPLAPVWRRYLGALEKAGLAVESAPPRLRGTAPAAPSGAIVLAPGAGRETKRWPAPRFAEAARLLAERTARPIIVVGSEKERVLLEEVRAGAPDRARVAAGLPIAEVAALLRSASLVVTTDSGLLHLANGVETPVVAVFGPTTPELGFGPSGSRDRVVSVDLSCRPCSLHGTDRCPLPDRSHICMTRIEAEEVVRAALAILGDTTGTAG
ncbi:MAG: glycosyltransferase family 9 protein [Candidatus Latescibacterota bacterium]|nr:MAG: glycosyltransferase family 9 protein [Candidatus Latescibacterota bacterium]